MSEYLKKVGTIVEIAKSIDKEIIKYVERKKAFDLIWPILLKQNGKQISKRIETAINKEIGDNDKYNIYIKKGYTYCELIIAPSFAFKRDGNDFYEMDLAFGRIGEVSTVSIEYIKEHHKHLLEDLEQTEQTIERLKAFKAELRDLIKEYNEFIDYMKAKSDRFKSLPYPAGNYFKTPYLY